MSEPRKIPDAAKTKIRQMRAEGYGIPMIALRSRIGLASVSRAITRSKTQAVTAVGSAGLTINLRSRDESGVSIAADGTAA